MATGKKKLTPAERSAAIKAGHARAKALKEGKLPKAPLVDDALFYLRRAVKRMKEDFKSGRKDTLSDTDVFVHIAIRCLEGEKV